ncbi:hypothetical protein DH86_00002997 [Scytalidium sp. 3C]|nr:hypothetical protein DH86_00002997 [Scytalidium sp. 3C]
MAICWCDTLKHHHDIEEEVYFPAIDAFSGEKGLMNDNIKGHAAFSGGLDQLAQYVYNAEKDISLFSAKELKRMINIFAPAFMAHMVDEIPTLLELETYGNEEAALKMFQDTEAIIVASLDKYRSTPLLFKGHDKTFEGSIHSWPQVPFFVPYLIHYIYSRKYEGAWRFAPCSTWGEPLPLKM